MTGGVYHDGIRWKTTNNDQKFIATPAFLSVAQRNVSLRPPGVSLFITHCGAAAGRAMLVVGL